MLLAKKLLVISCIFFLAVLAVSFVSAADVNINAKIPGGGPPPPPSIVYGCTDSSATNYNPSATVNNGTCIYNIPGCTDSDAINYNPAATVDDGSCILPIPGCTNPAATNYNPLANQDDGSCIIPGCTNPAATNFNSQATIDDGSCIYQISGCTNPLADNYNQLATIDDGSCIVSGCTNSQATNYDSQATLDDGSCIILGCTDPTAVNFNPQATVDNGTCSYDPNDIPGCTDASALNYNPQATIDNGSCTYLVPGCTDSRALNYNPSAAVNNGTCIYPLPVVTGLDYHFFTNNNGLQLYPQNNNIDLLINSELLILIPDNFSKEVQKIVATIGGEILPLKYDTESKQYLLKLNRFTSVGQTDINLMVVYSDNSAEGKNIIVTTHPYGQVFSKLPQDQTRIFGISISLYDENNNLIIQLSKISSDGTYGFMVENGRYRLVVFDNGQKIYDGRLFRVNNNIINRDIGLTLLEQIIRAVQETLDNPIVEETNKYAAPAMISVVTASTLWAIPWWGLVNYLQYLFTEPLAWLFRRRKKGWGIVYNSITKKPIDLAIVRLYDKTSGKLLKSKVTDKAGRYNFLVLEGNYYLEVVKSSMIFPSQILKDRAEDKQFIGLYHGESIVITKDQKGIITANIPVDPQDVKLSNKEILKQNFWYNVQKNISLIGPVFAIVSFVIYPSLLIGSFAVFHIVLYLLFKRLAAKDKANKWGVVLDAKTGKPVAGSVAKIYSPQYDKMLEAQVTDRHGRYGFLAGNNVYYIAATKDGYAEAKTNTIDLTHQKSEEVIGQDIELRPIADQSSSINKDDTNIPKKEETTLPAKKIEEIKPEIKSTPGGPGEEIVGKTEEKFGIPETVEINQQPEARESSSLEEMAEKLKQEAEKSIQPIKSDSIEASLEIKSSDEVKPSTPTEIISKDEITTELPSDDKPVDVISQVKDKPDKESKFG